MKKNIIVTGANGQLGHDFINISKIYGKQPIPLSHKDFDLTDYKALKHFFDEHDVDYLLHGGAYTNVDMAEDERESAYKANVETTKILSQVCSHKKIPMIYISSDYVYSGEGTKPWSISDKPNPINYYGETKYLGELEIKKYINEYYILRVSWNFGIHGKNFIKTMLNLASSPDVKAQEKKLSIVDDQVGSPTSTSDLSHLIINMIERDEYGIYNASNEGYCSWYEYADYFFKKLDLKIDYEPIHHEHYPQRAKRPLNSRLDKSCLDNRGFSRLPHWKSAVDEFLKQFKQLNN